VLRCDNGPEFIAIALGEFAENILGIHYIPPGQPWRNGYVESFNSRVRDECLNMNPSTTFMKLARSSPTGRRTTTSTTGTQNWDTSRPTSMLPNARAFTIQKLSNNLDREMGSSQLLYVWRSSPGPVRRAESCFIRTVDLNLRQNLLSSNAH